jgi:uncharacterized protein (DUF1684 family)
VCRLSLERAKLQLVSLAFAGTSTSCLANRSNILTRVGQRSLRAGNILVEMISPTDCQELVYYRRSVSRIYAGARGETAGSPTDEAARSQRFRTERDALLKNHPQSPLSEADREHFSGPGYFDYDPSLKFTLVIERDVEPGTLEITLQDDGPLRLRRFGKVRFGAGDDDLALTLFWISGYGGGRCLLDTTKHADLGSENGRLIVDFNYAYNPSCAYDPRWHCPVTPPENSLRARIAAGEKSHGR